MIRVYERKNMNLESREEEQGIRGKILGLRKEIRAVSQRGENLVH
jgi:hypothetical protein